MHLHTDLSCSPSEIKSPDVDLWLLGLNPSSYLNSGVAGHTGACHYANLLLIHHHFTNEELRFRQHNKPKITWPKMAEWSGLMPHSWKNFTDAKLSCHFHEISMIFPTRKPKRMTRLQRTARNEHSQGRESTAQWRVNWWAVEQGRSGVAIF